MAQTGPYPTIDDKVDAIKQSPKVSRDLKELVQEIKLRPLKERVGPNRAKGIGQYNRALALEFDIEGRFSVASARILVGPSPHDTSLLVGLYHVLGESPQGYDPLKGIFYFESRYADQPVIRTGISGLFQLTCMDKIKKLGVSHARTAEPMTAWYGQFVHQDGERKVWRADPAQVLKVSLG